MFTGIVEESARVISFRPGPRAWKLKVTAGRAAAGVAAGDSIAVNGCCLTVARRAGKRLEFDVLEQTRRVTNFAALLPGGEVNLERSLRLGGRMGGHFVTGHIDGTGEIEVLEPRGRDTYLRIRAPREFARYLLPKGSVAVDGISLTVAEVAAERFAVWIIPTTLAVTCLGKRRVGDAVNLEFDLLGKYVESLIRNADQDAKRPRRPDRRAAPTQGRRPRVGRRLG